ncbi:MAG: hypothetical protein ACTHMC_17545 [Pseudobacter sp.]|uniref:hypothetical protein n=1 Tax=Pseudobacter sp. TaxID=2045420 RepID=UPI003F7D7C82
MKSIELEEKELEISTITGMTITDIIESYGKVAGWLDYSDCLLQDYLSQENDDYSGYFELSNGCLICHRSMAPSGTGLAGLHWYESISKLKEETIFRYTENYARG